MNLPSAKQAHAFWLNSIGMSPKDIAKVTGCSPQSAQGALAQARAKAQQCGLKFVVKKSEEVKVGSGFSIALQLANEIKQYRVKTNE